MEKEAIKFIDKIYRDLYLSDEVLHHSTGNKTDKYRNIKEYLDMLSELHERASVSNHRKELLKRMYRNKYVIKPEDIPESFYEAQKRIALERGYGHVKLTKDLKNKLQEQVIKDQEKSLDVWLDYFLSDDAKMYPFWAKYWAFQGMLKLGTYNKENKTYNRRTKNTTAIFADLNQEALALSIDMMINVLNKKEIDDKELEVLLKGGSFQRIYPYIENNILSNNNEIVKRNDGRWVKYNQGTDHMPLVNSLKGYNTGWCTAGESMAASQLAGGDFYVYYTLDANGEYKVPRIAIRMEGDDIGEIRGIAKNQNLEQEMEEVVEEKLKEFPDRDKYYKKVNDMKRLTAIYNTYTEHKELSLDDLRFLYEVDGPILGFGYRRDPRIEEILSSRDTKTDVSQIYNCSPGQVALESIEVFDNTVVSYVQLYLSTTNVDSNLKLPQAIYNDLTFATAKTIKNFKFPKLVTGTVSMLWVKKVENVTFPEDVRGMLYLPNVTTLKNVKFPKVCNRVMQLYYLVNCENVIFPEEVSEGILLTRLNTTKKLVLPKLVKGQLSLDSLKNAKNVTFPEKVYGSVILDSLTTAEGLKLPKTVNGSIHFRSLTNAKGLVLPDKVGGMVYLDGLKNAKDLVLPKEFGGGLILSNLTSARGLNLPEVIHGSLDLTNLKSTDGLILPNRIEGDLVLDSIKYCKDLVLPQVVLGRLLLSNLQEADGLFFPEVANGIRLGLKKAKNVYFPKYSSYIIMPHLESIDKLVLPRIISSDLDIQKLTNVEELVLPDVICNNLYITEELLRKVDLSYLETIVKGTIYVDGMMHDRFMSIKGIN